MSILPQSSRVRAALLCLIAGVPYLIASPMYAKACHAAPAGMVETVFGVPAFVFTAVGCVLTVVGTVMLIVSTYSRNES